MDSQIKLEALRTLQAILGSQMGDEMQQRLAPPMPEMPMDGAPPMSGSMPPMEGGLESLGALAGAPMEGMPEELGAEGLGAPIDSEPIAEECEVCNGNGCPACAEDEDEEDLEEEEV